MYRNESSGSYYAWVKKSGKQIKKSLKTKDLALAKRRLREFYGLIDQADPNRRKLRLNFDQVAENWLFTLKPHLKPMSYRRRETSINALRPYFGGVGVRSISRRNCEEWANKRAVQRAASTFNNELGTLNNILDYAVQEGFILSNPAKNLRRRPSGRHELVIPTRDQFRTILKQLRNLDIRYWHAADLLELLAYSGMRLGEAVEFRWKHIDEERGLFLVTGGEAGTKNHDVRTVPVFPALKAFLDRRKAAIGDIDPDARIVSISNASKALRAVCALLGFTRFTHHSMRHFFVSNAIEKGIDFKTIAAWVGHKDGGILVAQTYGHLRDVHSMEMAQRMVAE